MCKRRVKLHFLMAREMDSAHSKVEASRINYECFGLATYSKGESVQFRQIPTVTAGVPGLVIKPAIILLLGT
jgi:hypothetical protein